MEELLLYWMDVLERDLKGFADPLTVPEVSDYGLLLTARWTQRGQPRDARFELGASGDFRWIDHQGRPQPYPDFLKSTPMGDFAQLARAIGVSFPSEPYYVSTRAEIDAGDDGLARSGASDSLIVEVIEESLEQRTGLTQLVFLKGDAGAGKTTLLRQITSHQARRFLENASPFLFFYVSAQGRALSNLADAISGELDDLRAAFTRDAVATFVRHSVLVPIIDGFDELLGAAGYGDAFGSLQQFLQTLDGSGVIVVSARSSFYDVEFIGSGSRPAVQLGAFDLMPITLHPWSEDEIATYLSRIRGQNDGAAERDRILSLSERDRQLLGKPFFARQFAEFAEDGMEEGALLEQLIDGYLKRESAKIVDRDNRPLLPIDGHRRLFELTAEEMWSKENRRLTANDLRTLAELVAEENGLSGDAARQLATKITSYAGFATSAAAQDFTFEHEVYFDFFLAQTLSRHIEDASLSTSYLNSGVLPEEIIDLAVSPSHVGRLNVHLQGLASSSGLFDNYRRNAGALYACCFRKGLTLEESRIEIRDASFVNVDFGESELRGIDFVNCSFVGARLDKAKLRDCRATGCFAEGIVLSTQSHWGIEGFQPGHQIASIIFFDNEGRQDTYVPSEIAALLATIGGPRTEDPIVVYSGHAAELLDLLGQFAQLFRRMNIACRDDDTGPARRVFKDKHWDELHELLVEHGIVRDEKRSASGPRRIFYRPLVPLPEVMRYEEETDLPDDSVGSFWRALRGAS